MPATLQATPHSPVPALPPTQLSGLGDTPTCLNCFECFQNSISIKRFYLSHGHSKMPFGQSSYIPWSSVSMPYTYFKEIL